MSIYNEDELVHPSWVNNDFFVKVLKQYEKTEIVDISDVDISPASLKGDHYASVIYRCKICYTCDKCVDSKVISLIMKTLPCEDGHKHQLLKESSVFETEIDMYTEAIPAIENILAECGEPTKLAPQIIYHSLEPHKVIIFEDLCASGYHTLRERYLYEDEIKIVYSKIAKLHAVSFSLGKSENHEIVTKYMKGLFASSTIMAMGFMASGICNFINLLKQHDDFKVYVDKIRAMQPEMTEKCKKLYDAYKLNGQQSQTDILVLNHGDFHKKNLMFKFNTNNRVEDVIMVDYQISCYGPSVIDLTYSQYMLLSPELRLKKNELMYYYFEAFTDALRKIDFRGEMPRYSDFQICGLKYRHFSLFLLSTFLPLVHAILVPKVGELQDVDIAKILEHPETAATVYQHPEFINEMYHLLPILLVNGYLD